MMGSGGVGGFFRALLQLARAQVVFIARGAVWATLALYPPRRPQA